ncbi:restriction endonuclease subunit S [Microbacterium sp. NPDC091662]|uniref:restriction endonuclease subunit S n=1 Tax=Microbacterium sp. NPDC091662 TaxID=3364211 RepID=UPI00382C78B9
MNRIDDLLRELCANGVDHVELGSVVRIRNGSDYKALGVGSVPVYGSGGVMTTVDTAVHDGPSVLIPRKGSLGNLFYINEPFWTVDTIFYTEIDEVRLVPKFFYYVMSTQRLAEKNQAGGVPSMTQSYLNRLRIPVPPLEVQREIVEILDKFAELEAELEAELKARRVQYTYYRRAMLDQPNVPRVSLADLGSWFGGMTPSKQNSAYWEGGDVPWLASMDVSDESTNKIRGRVTARAIQETSLKVVPAPSIPVVMRSNILRRTLPVGFVEVDTTVNQDVRALVVGDGVDARYAYQVLRADSERIREQCVRTDGSMAAVSSKSFFAWQVPLPDLAEQRRIAAALDEFDTLVNDVSIGLPAELVARRKQYEHYRDKLLAFRKRD